MKWPTEPQFQETCDTITRNIDRIRQDGYELVRRARIGTRDGFPTSTRPGNHGNTGSIVEAVALADQHDDPVRHHVNLMLEALNHACESILLAGQWRARALPPTIQEPADPGCINCLRHGTFTVAWQAGRCEACYRYRLRNQGEERTKQLIETPRRIRSQPKSA